MEMALEWRNTQEIAHVDVHVICTVIVYVSMHWPVALLRETGAAKNK